MKKYLLLFVLYGAGLMAQPTFNSTDMFGVNFTYVSKNITNASSIDVSTTGANSVWNFSGLVTGTESINTFISPAGNPGAANFPQANLCQANTTSGGNPAYSYMKVSANAYSLDGVFSNQQGFETVSQFNPDMDLFRFPFSFNSTFTQAIGGTTTSVISGVSYAYIRVGSQTIICDGYGTLTTPLGTFENVLRLRTTQVYSDSINIQGVVQVFNYEATIFNWVSAQSKGASLLSQTSFSVDGTESISGTLSTLPTVGIAETFENLSFNLFPNPAKDQLMIQLPVKTTETLTAEIFSVTGQFIRKIEIINHQSLQINFQLDGIAPGAYLLRLSGQKSAGLQRFIIM